MGLCKSDSSRVTLTGEGEDDEDVDKNSKQFLDHGE